MVKLIAVTKGVGELEGKSAQEIISYAARVSSPKNQSNFDTAGKLLKYCIKNKHWSIFETASMTLEVNTSRAISAQIIRHKFKIQEFSQRYAESTTCEIYEARRQDEKNRQNSIDDMSEEDKTWFTSVQLDIQNKALTLYQQALNRGIAKELARMLLPMSSTTKLYLTNDIRGWIHYIEVRSHESTQKEHRDIALECKRIFCEQFPDIAEALEWSL